MIETREHYELLQRKAEDRRILDAEDVKELTESINALLTLVTAVRESKTDDDGFVFDALGEPLIDAAYDALPEWMKKR